MSVSEQQSSQEFDAGGFGSITRGQLSAMLLNNEASESALQLPLVSPEVINLSRISPNDDSQEGLYGGGGIGISPSEDHHGYESRRRPLDLHTLWRLLEQMDKEARKNGVIGGGVDRKTIGINSIDGVQVPSDWENGTNQSDTEASEGGKMSTWELVVLQAVLLSLLIFISLLWAFCCKRKCLSEQPLMTEMVALARKISNGSSKDLPPSYSKVDLTQEGLTIEDHFNPPPNYDRAADLHHNEIERKRIEAEGDEGRRSGRTTPAPDYTPTLQHFRNRPVRLAASSSIGSVSSTSISSISEQQQTQDSESSQNSQTCVVSIEAGPSSPKHSAISQRTAAKFSISSTTSSSSSTSASSRKSSRVTFSPILEEGPTNRKESSQSLPCKSVLVSKISEAYRKKSTTSEGGGGSRKVSFVFEELPAGLKGGSRKRVDPDPLLERALEIQLELASQAGEMDEFVSSSNNLNTKGVQSSPPMI